MIESWFYQIWHVNEIKWTNWMSRAIDDVSINWKNNNCDTRNTKFKPNKYDPCRRFMHKFIYGKANNNKRLVKLFSSVLLFCKFHSILVNWLRPEEKYCMRWSSCVGNRVYKIAIFVRHIDGTSESLDDVNCKYAAIK